MEIDEAELMQSPADTRPAGEGRHYPSLVRNRDYLILWSGQTVSAVGTQVSRLAFPLLILLLTRSPAQAGFVSAMNSIPYVVLALLAGALVDRLNRKRVMILCDTGRALVLASIPLAAWTGHLSVAQLYLVALVGGSLDVFFDLAETASLPLVVGKEQLSAAMAQNNATFSISSLIGQPLGGALFQLGRSVPFLVDAVSYAASVLSLLFVRIEFQEASAAQPEGLRAQIVEGFTWLWRQPLIRFMAFLNAGLWTVISGGYLLVIVIARQLHTPPSGIGIILATLGVGGVVGALAVRPVQRRFSFAQIVVGGLGLSTLFWALYAVVPNAVALGIVVAAGGVVFPVYNVVQMSYRIALIPNQLQGRVNSIFRLIAFSGQPVGLALTGTSLQLLGVRFTVLLGALWLLALTLWAALNRHVRSARPLVEEASG